MADFLRSYLMDAFSTLAYIFVLAAESATIKQNMTCYNAAVDRLL